MNLERLDMIDRVHHVSPDHASISCASTVPSWSLMFEAHFPDYPVVPGVMLLETMVHAGSYLYLLSNECQALPILLHVEGAKFLGPARPSESLRTTVDLLYEGPNYNVYKGTMFLGSQKVVKSRFKLILVPFPTELDRQRMVAKLEDVLKETC